MMNEKTNNHLRFLNEIKCFYTGKLSSIKTKIFIFKEYYSQQICI